MSRLIPILFICTFLYSQSPATWWEKADSNQRASIRGSYERNKQYEKGWTLAALNAIESSGGLHLLRLGEDSAGLYAQRGKNVAKRENKHKRLEVPFDSLWAYSYREIDNPTGWEISRAVQRLIRRRVFDDAHARAHLAELLRQYDYNWMKVWQAWNGHKEHQAEEVRSWIRFLKTIFK